VTVRVRPHHLLCLLTYVGRGYDAKFTANFDTIARHLGRGEEILIVSGPDDICRPLLDTDENHCDRESVAERDRLAARDVSTLLGQSIREGTSLRLNAKLVARMRRAFTSGRTRAACAGCNWVELCTEVAESTYRGALV